MKICIISNAHRNTDVRLYYKIGRSLAKLADVYLICPSGVRQEHSNPYQRVVNAENARAALRLLYHEAKLIKPHLVICVEPLTMPVGMALRRKLGCKVVFDIHEFYADAFGERFSPLIAWLMKLIYLSGEHWLSSKADACIGVNEEILAQAVPKELRQKSIVIPNYPVKNVWDYPVEMPADLSSVCGSDFDMIYIGGLTRDRGVFRILQASAVLKREFPQLKVLIVGKFHPECLEREFERMTDQLGLSGVIYYQPWIAAEKIGLLLKRCRIGLWLFDPRNRRMKRAMPLKVLEYFAAGLPVVSTKTSLMKALIAKNEVGEVCDYKSANIATSIQRILKLPQSEYEKMQKRAIDLINERYNWERLEPRLLEFIQNLMG